MIHINVFEQIVNMIILFVANIAHNNLPDKELALMRKMDGYIKFAMSYRDMAIIDMAIMHNIKINGNRIEISGKPVYEIYFEFSNDVKENILKFIRIAYARETFNIIDRIWKDLDKDRAMINYPELYWLSQVAMVKKAIVCRKIKESVDSLKEAEHALCLKNLLSSRMEKVLVLWNAAFKSIGVSYKNEILPHEEMIRLRDWKEEAAKLNYSRELTEMQLSMCRVLSWNLQNAPFSKLIKMVEA